MERAREGKTEREKAVGFSGVAAAWITVVNFEMDDTGRGG